MAPTQKLAPGERKSAKQADIPWLARLTHPLVFFGASVAICESIVGTALLTGTHSDETTIWLCTLMAAVVVAAMGFVAFLAYKKPTHLMLTQQDTVGEETRKVESVRRAARVLLNRPKPKTPAELLSLMDEVELALAGDSQ